MFETLDQRRDRAGLEVQTRGDRADTLVVAFPPILPPKDGSLFLDKAKFAAAFAADVEPEKADFMARSQVPWGVEALQGAATEPAWKSKPSFYLVATEDQMIPPPAQRMMAARARSVVREAAGSYAIYVSRPGPVADIVEASSA